MSRQVVDGTFRLSYAHIMTELKNYIFNEIVPRYGGFDPAHREDHALTVISQAMELLERMPHWLASQKGMGTDVSEWDIPVRDDILLTAAAFHDLGLINGRDNHHLDSGKIIRSDEKLKLWFSPEEIEIIAQAAEDHRASGKSAPRSIYGMLVAEADRVIDGNTIILRTIQFGFRHYPDLNCEGHMERAVTHLREKYGRDGYLKLWIPWSDNAARLAELQDIIADDDAIYLKVSQIIKETV